MSKATTANIEALGFDTTQFGTPPDFTAYLTDVLDDMALEVRALLGATRYDAASSTGTDAQKLDFMRIKNAEMYLSAAELWRRIEIHERRNVYKGRGDGGTETVSSRVLANAEKMAVLAETYLMAMGVSLAESSSGGIACGVNESGPYDAVSG